MFINNYLRSFDMKKQHKKESKSQFKISKQKILISIIVLVLVISGIYLATKNKVAATVGDEVIYQKSVDAIFKSLPSSSGLTKGQILQRIIDTKVLTHYIEASGFAITDAEFEAELQNELENSGLTKEEFEDTLALSGATLDDFKDSKTIEYYVRTQVDPIIVIDSNQIVKFKQENPAANLTDAQIKNALFLDARQQLVQAIIKLHKQSMEITIK